MGYAASTAESSSALSRSGTPATDDWRAKALCADEPPDLFFPIGASQHAARQVAEAKRVCARCAVRETCLAWALECSPVEGVFGGTDQAERREILHRR